MDTSNYMVANSNGIYYATSYAYSIDSMKFYGLQLEVNSKIFGKLDIFGNYSYRKSEYDKSSFPASQHLDLPPKHKANMGLRYPLFVNTLITSDLRYVGERKSEGGKDLKEYFVMDAGLEQKLPKGLVVSVFVNNLFGQNYQEVYGFPMPKQTFGIRAKLSF